MTRDVESCIIVRSSESDTNDLYEYIYTHLVEFQVGYLYCAGGGISEGGVLGGDGGLGGAVGVKTAGWQTDGSGEFLRSFYFLFSH